MIVYTKTCLPCTHRQQWRDLRQIARRKSIPLEVRRITYNPVWKSEAEKYERDLPFIVNEGKVLSLSEALEGLKK
jgi:hypothetical protein